RRPDAGRRRTRSPAMFDRFTDRARKVIALAKAEAKRLNHGAIGTEHLLLGLVEEGSGVAANVLKNMKVDLARIRAQVEEIARGRPAAAAQGILPFTPRAKKILELAIEEASRLGHNYFGTEHLLIGMIQENEGIAARVLLLLGVKLDEVRDEVLLFLGADPRRVAEVAGSAAPSPTASQEPPFAERTPLPRSAHGHGSRSLVRLLRELELSESHARSLRERIAGIEHELGRSAWEAARRAAPQLSGERAAAEDSLGCTERCRLVLQRARGLALLASRSEVGSEQVLQALLFDGTALPVVALRELGVELAALRTAVGLPAADRPLPESTMPLPASAAYRVAAAAAEYAARRLGQPSIGSAHLLLGLLEAPGDRAAALLAKAGVDVAALRATLERHLAGAPWSTQLLGLRADLDAAMRELRVLRSSFAAVQDEMRRFEARVAALLWQADLE
ncbi:MAG: Clp protease N-terminal domain-containing protein, partial [Planctomycetota bacterium]